jgi:hypothetical protein
LNSLFTTYRQQPLAWFCHFMPVYWLAWWSCQLWIDVTGSMRSMGWIDAPWGYLGNYHFLVQSLEIFSVPNWFPGLLLLIIIIWLAIICLLFLLATINLIRVGDRWIFWTNHAFICSFLLWMAFFIADQLVLHFDVEQNHMVQASFEFLCFLFLQWQIKIPTNK